MGIKEIRVGVSSCGLAAGARVVLDKLKLKASVPVNESGCIGHCYVEPLIEVVTDTGSLFYGSVTDSDADIENILSLNSEKQITLNGRRTSRITDKIGKFVPGDIDAFIELGGFKALDLAAKMERSAIIEEVKLSELKGRGGGGFPTGLKWSFFAAHDGKKILVCNADEGDPGAFMDRSLMESLPCQLIEGMLIAAYATKAETIFIYCRAEYPLAIKNLQTAIKKINEKKLNIVNGQQIDISIKEGAGAFVCGEETALIHSLEGKRGMPRFRPPFPTDKGYDDYPTMINNVETFANIPFIIEYGADEYKSVGTPGGRGTKLFAIAGDVPRPGLIEVPMGITLKEIIYDIGGAEEGSVKAVQTGGPSGGCIPEGYFDTPVDYDSLRKLGAIMGSGGLIVIGKQRCMVETSRYFLDFTHRESCGKCTFCRVGTKRMFDVLTSITKGTGTLHDLEFLKNMGKKVQDGSLCGLGKTAPNPVLSSLRYFEDEFIEHVSHNRCRTLECSSLVDIVTDHEKCTSCGRCVKTCPAGCISDSFVADNSICTRCNSCIEVCRDNAISRAFKGEGFYSNSGEEVKNDNQ
ncbi:MAG: 4Fe-4S binding protein [Deltaproteobacteria bacterium]|nr:4Fe-4S binding protein [Deltaproteobacteria bacterium]